MARFNLQSDVQHVVADAARCPDDDRATPKFPDPTVEGQLTPQMVSAAGIDTHQRGVLAAGFACAPVTHRLITRAAVERAVKGG